MRDHNSSTARAANDDQRATRSKKRRKAKRIWPSPEHLALIAVGAVANLVAVTLGLYGAAGIALPVAFGFAVVLTVVQTILFEQIFRNGLVLGAGASFFYGIVVAVNILLAAGGITAALGAGVLGQSTFRASVVSQLDATRQVTDSASGFALAMSGVATHSAEQHRLEVAQGNTCGTSDKGEGPISRLREDDASTFAAAQQTMSQVSAEAAQISASIDNAIANYTVAKHEQVTQTIRDAVGKARQLASDPRMASVRATLATRAAQINNGRPDRLNPSLLVMCPRDTTLGRVINEALAKPLPQALAEFEAPPVPSEATSVQGLISALVTVVTGGEADLSPWRLSLIAAPLPDSLFMFGLLIHRRRRKKLQPYSEQIAEKLGAEGYSAQEIARVMESERVQRLQAAHFRERRGWFRIDWLVIEEKDVARRSMMMQIVDLHASDLGLRQGTDFPFFVAPGRFDPNATFHLFGLWKGVWSRLEADEIRAALADLDDPGPDRPTPQQGATFEQEQAA